MRDAAKNITDRQIAVKAFADGSVRTNEERILPDSRAESIFGRRVERILIRNVKTKFSHASREFGDASGKFFHGQAEIGIPLIKMSDRQNQAER